MTRPIAIAAALFGASAIVAADATSAATVTLEGLSRFSFQVVNIAFADPDAAGAPGAPRLDDAYSLSVTTSRREDEVSTSGPATGTIAVGEATSNEFGGEGSAFFRASGESPGGTVNFASGAFLATVTLRQLGDLAIALTLDYTLEAFASAVIDNPGAAVDPAAGFVSILTRFSTFGFDDILIENVETGFNNFSDLEPPERIDFERFVTSETRRVTLVSLPGQSGGRASLSAFAGGQLLLGDGEPVVVPPEPVAPIPLPAAGWMLLGGLGALAALRRLRA